MSIVAGLALAGLTAANEPVPHAQDKPPGPPLSPAEAIAKMTVPEGFSVELVASEPDIVNPVAMTFDERGRVWITESLEYPRHDAGPGQDRVKILEDTDGDGRADKFTVFADGLNIPSGIAVGAGGVWVINAPDLLYLQDTDGDGHADRREVVLTGFGRNDTHELPNSLTWGPDGWLYGLNGVFNHCHVNHQGRDYDFTCALFRIHPRTRAFELFAEGTSNPWGVAWDSEGSALLSACVIDHLWHLTETGYYQRQGGPYPPFTSIAGSIVRHHHQKAAYCGIHYFDSDAYPAEYRQRLYMGNIHGGCLNVDRLERDGSTYLGVECPDFLTANDAWFMPVVQKTGPDGCLYVLDWYDRYHCYQDAGRDPKGIDRLKGRLYRIRYQNTPHAAPFDLAKESDEQLIARLSSPNVFYRDLAQRLLWERNHGESRPRLEQLVLDDAAPRTARLHALWALVGTGALDGAFHRRLLAHADPTFRAWGVRAVGNFGRVDADLVKTVLALAADASPDVRLQVAIASRKLDGVNAAPVLLEILSTAGDDKLIPHIVWQNLHPLVEEHAGEILDTLARTGVSSSPALQAAMPRLVERLLARKDPSPDPVVKLITLVATGPKADAGVARSCLATLAARIESHEVAGDRLAGLKAGIEPVVAPILAGGGDQSLFFDAAVLATALGSASGSDAVYKIYRTSGESAARRRQSLQSLVAAHDARVRDAVAGVLADAKEPLEVRGQTLDLLGRSGEPWVAGVVLADYARFEPELQPKAIDLLTERPEWAHALLDAIGRHEIPPSALNVNQVRKLLASKENALVEKVRAQWGTLRTDRNPQREQVIGDVRQLLGAKPGDPQAGQVVFNRVCGQCHKIYGVGQDVGPDLTSNGRSSLDQLLSNVLDPSLVIGAGYLARIVVTDDGRVLTGLPVEDNEQRLVLKIQGGKLETIARSAVEEVRVSQLSLMPEELEKQIKPEEMVDLFAFLALDKPPSDPSARQLPGLPAPAAK
ncbi:MAG TPA: PVC-type heme-binding CxxCH protein [Pirellulales bacterium]|nr:PVC-type heme-binding CxxCH protein [Pirellulales bacterium]